VRLVRVRRRRLALGAAGGQVLFEWIEQLPRDQIRFREFLERRLRLPEALRSPARGGQIDGLFSDPVLRAILQGFRPGRKHRFAGLSERLGNLLSERGLGLQRVRFDGKDGLRLRPGLGLRNQALAEAARGTFGVIATTLDGLIGPFPFARTIAASLAVALRVPSPFGVTIFGVRRLDVGGPEGHVCGLGCRRPAARFATPAAVAFPARVAAAVALTRGRFGIAARRRAPVEVLRFDVRDVEEAVAADRKIDERSLNGRLEVDDPSLINVARKALVAGTLDVKLFENTVFDDGDPAFFGLFHVDQHFFLHAISFRYLRPP
jgi:hypothetical protein